MSDARNSSIKVYSPVGVAMGSFSVDIAEMLGLIPKPTDPVKGVWFNDPYTTVRWADGTVTTVRCSDDDVYDPMLGFLLCVAKRHFGNTGRYLDVMRRHGVPESTVPTIVAHVESSGRSARVRLERD